MLAELTVALQVCIVLMVLGEAPIVAHVCCGLKAEQ